MPSVSVRVDLSEIGRLAKTLERDTASTLRREIRKAVNGVGREALQRVKDEAATFSEHIPAQTTMKTSFAGRGAGVTIQTNLRKVPYAKYWERGSTGSGGRYFKHPVYGSQNEAARPDVRARYDEKESWGKHDTHPYFYSRVWADRDELKNRLRVAIAETLHSLGF